jgi:hypothetical protein
VNSELGFGRSADEKLQKGKKKHARSKVLCSPFLCMAGRIRRNKKSEPRMTRIHADRMQKEMTERFGTEKSVQRLCLQTAYEDPTTIFLSEIFLSFPPFIRADPRHPRLKNLFWVVAEGRAVLSVICG